MFVVDVNFFKACRLLYTPPGLKLKKKLRAEYVTYMSFVCISEQTPIFAFVHHQQTGFYNWRAECLQRGTDWVLI